MDSNEELKSSAPEVSSNIEVNVFQEEMDRKEDSSASGVLKLGLNVFHQARVYHGQEVETTRTEGREGAGGRDRELADYLLCNVGLDLCFVCLFVFS